MRRTLLCLLTILLFATGCSAKASSGFSADDLRLTIAGNDYINGANIESVIAQMGDGYEYAEGKSCAYDGLDKTYTYEAATFFTNPLEAGDIVSEIYSESETVITSKGLTIGAAKADVTTAYGTPAEDSQNMLIYRLPDTQGALCFELVDDTVVAVFLTIEAI